MIPESIEIEPEEGTEPVAPTLPDGMEIEPEPEANPQPKPEPEPSKEPAPMPPAALARPALMEVLPADFPLPALIRFVPDARLRLAAEEATAYLLSVDVTGVEGLQRADVALAAERDARKAIEAHFAEPVDIANKLHKSLTTSRGEWCRAGEDANRIVGRKVATEKARLDAIAAEERRKAQAEADRVAREQAIKEAKAAEQAKAPAAVVEQMKREAETVTAPPVPVTTAAPTLRHTTTTTTWKARLAGSAADANPNPDVSELTLAQRRPFFELLQAIIDGKAPLTAVEINWSVLNNRAKADKSTLAIPGIEAWADSGTRAKGRRS